MPGYFALFSGQLWSTRKFGGEVHATLGHQLLGSIVQEGAMLDASAARHGRPRRLSMSMHVGPQAHLARLDACSLDLIRGHWSGGRHHECWWWRTA
jgi:hypothetical protein